MVGPAGIEPAILPQKDYELCGLTGSLGRHRSVALEQQCAGFTDQPSVVSAPRCGYVTTLQLSDSPVKHHGVIFSCVRPSGGS